ncbi:MAG: hypothetical protein ACPGYF_04860 [Chitinophagales bacterium]
MYNEQIEKLIEMALMDGELTEKEKQVLFKKAEAMGIDLDEFEMVLDAKLFEKKQAMQASAPPPPSPPPAPAAPKSDKYGDVKKCPSCGAMVESFKTSCGYCGHAFTNVDANSSIERLFKMLNEAEDMRVMEKQTDNPFAAIGGALSDALSDISGPGKVDRKKMEIISNFPIPTTKEDMLEFLSLALPRAQKKGNFLTANQPENKIHNSFVNVWHAKCEQVIMKARFAMKDDKKTLEEINHYASTLKIK